MQKNICTLFFITIILCNFNLVGQDENIQPPFTQDNVSQDDIPTDIPHYLHQRRKDDIYFIKGFIRQLHGERGAIRKVEQEMVTRVNNDVYEAKVNYCYMPTSIQWLTWFGHLIFWDNNYSEMEMEIKKFNDKIQKKYEEIKNSSKELIPYYEKRIGKMEHAITNTCILFECECNKKRDKLNKIGKKGENGWELLPNPDTTCLKQQKVDRKKTIIIKNLLKSLHSKNIPVTQEEVESILAIQPSFEKSNNKLEIIIKNHNKLVEEYENNKKEKEIFNKNNEN